MRVDLKRVNEIRNVEVLVGEADERVRLDAGLLLAETADRVRCTILVVIVGPICVWHMSGVKEGLVVVAYSCMLVQGKIWVRARRTNAHTGPALVAMNVDTVGLELFLPAGIARAIRCRVPVDLLPRARVARVNDHPRRVVIKHALSCDVL